MKKVLLAVTTMLFAGLVQSAICEERSLSPADVPRISIEELKAKLEDPDVAIIDVRSAHDWDDSNTKIKGAIREEPSKLDSWVKNYPKDKTIVLYCK